ncbi:MAG TPA: hypothetical protein VF590_16565 [Isosphaeraceae bacterium]|jgi:methionine synthase II (cobalamin-independent)
MFDQILESYRQATESTMQLQQMMLRNWTQQWPQQWPGAMGMIPTPATAWAETAQAAQKNWSETVTDMLTKHRETLDAQYRAGIRTIEDAFRLGAAKDPEQFRRLTEELWRQSFECLKTVVEAQMRDVQAAMQKWFEVAAQGAAAAKL